jgi:hypothetical protein
MSQKQYLKTIQKELIRINKIIDSKILQGKEYKKEARDHKLLLKKIRYIQRQNFWGNFSKKFSIRFRRSFNNSTRFASFF